jgi:hypothetical protein
MYDREHGDAGWLHYVEDNVRKSRHHRSPDIAIENRECFRKTPDRFESLAQRRQELVPETRAL